MTTTTDSSQRFIEHQPTCKECGAVQYQRYGHLAECSQFLEDAAPAPETGKWQQINSTVYELTTNERGEQVNRWSANVQGPRLQPGESEQVAAQIIADHASVPRLVEALNLVLPLAEQYATQHSAAPEWKRFCNEARAALALTTLRRSG